MHCNTRIPEGIPPSLPPYQRVINVAANVLAKSVPTNDFTCYGLFHLMPTQGDGLFTVVSFDVIMSVGIY